MKQIATSNDSGPLATLEGAIRTLAACTSLNVAKGIADKAAAAALWARKARLGLEAQNHAAEIKIRAERRAGELLKGLEKKERARTDLLPTSVPVSPFAAALEESETSPQAATRWQRLADVDERRFEEAIAAIKEAKEELTSHGVAKRAIGPHVGHNSTNNEWYTPDAILDAARAVLGGIDLDPASSEIANARVKAKRYFTADDDGPSKRWSGRVWMNPPYESGVIERFADKLVASMGTIEAAITLTNNATETGWFQTMAAAGNALCLPSSRVRFLRPDGSTGAPLQGQAILYFGKDRKAFEREFKKLGVVFWKP